MSDFDQRNKAFARGMADAQVFYIEAERAACDLEAENAKLRELLAKAGELIVIAEWPNVERDEMASAVMHDIRELGVDA